METSATQIPAERETHRNVDYPVLEINWRQEAEEIVFYGSLQQQGTDDVNVEGGGTDHWATAFSSKERKEE